MNQLCFSGYGKVESIFVTAHFTNVDLTEFAECSSHLMLFLPKPLIP